MALLKRLGLGKDATATAPSLPNGHAIAQSLAESGTGPLANGWQSEREAERFFGMENFGNTCYCNSVLQSLYFCRPFRELVLQRNPSSANPHAMPSHAPPSAYAGPDGTTMFSVLRDLFHTISAQPSTTAVVPAQAFVTKLRKENELFRSTMHQDAHEFLNYLLNKITEDLEDEDVPQPNGVRRGSAPRTPTLVQSLFEGALTNETRCLNCETVTSRDESFLDLSIDIEQHSSVTACLRSFSASEMLCQKNKYFCDACGGLQEAEKRMKVKKLPNVLALHLKRFKYQEQLNRYVKLSYRVVFPLELRLFNTCDDTENPDRLYGLFAIVIHIGAGPHHGHYIAIVKSGDRWVLFDDEKITIIDESDIRKYFGDDPAGSGYVLFYQARDLDREALGLPPLSSPPTVPPTPPVPQPQLVTPPPSTPITPLLQPDTLAPAAFPTVSTPPLPPAAFAAAAVEGSQPSTPARTESPDPSSTLPAGGRRVASSSSRPTSSGEPSSFLRPFSSSTSSRPSTAHTISTTSTSAAPPSHPPENKKSWFSSKKGSSKDKERERSTTLPWGSSSTHSAGSTSSASPSASSVRRQPSLPLDVPIPPLPPFASFDRRAAETPPSSYSASSPAASTTRRRPSTASGVVTPPSALPYSSPPLVPPIPFLSSSTSSSTIHTLSKKEREALAKREKAEAKAEKARDKAEAQRAAAEEKRERAVSRKTMAPTRKLSVSMSMGMGRLVGRGRDRSDASGSGGGGASEG